jgi:hypothetical protein
MSKLNLRRPVMPKQREQAKKNASAAERVYRLAFSKGTFPTEKAVKDWLAKFEYSDYKIEAMNRQFVAESTIVKADDLVEDSVRTVEQFKPGVDADIGTLTDEALKRLAKADDADTDTDTDTDADTDADTDTGSDNKGKKTKDGDDGDGDGDGDGAPAQVAKGKKKPGKYTDKDKAKKVDFWSMYLSGGQTPADVLKDGMRDGMPPGFDEIMFATTKSLANAMKDEDLSEDDLKKKLLKSANQMANLTFATFKTFKDILADEDASDSDKKSAQAFIDRVEKIAALDTSKIDINSGQVDIEKAILIDLDEGEDEDENEDEAGKKKPATTTADDSPIASALTSVSKAIEANAKVLAKVGQEVAGARKDAAYAKTEAEKAAKLVTKMAGQTQSKKADPDASEEQDKSTQKSAWGGDALSSALGMN